MEKNKISEVVTDLLFDKLLLNFAPGIILYYAIKSLQPFSEGEGLTSLIIIIASAWVLGALVETLFFQKSSIKRRESSSFGMAHKLNLMLGKIATAILVASVLVFISIAMDEEFSMIIFDHDRRERFDFEYEMIKTSIFGAIGLIFLLIYKRRSNQMN